MWTSRKPRLTSQLATVIERKLGEVAKRFARLFFESELADKIRGLKTLKSIADYQEIGGIKHPFSDLVQAQSALDARAAR